mgnify:CR=1 FL=1
MRESRRTDKRGELYDAIREHGQDAFTREALSTFDTKEAGEAFERLRIAELGTLWPNGLNIKTGERGDQGPEHRRRTTEANRRLAQNAEAIRRRTEKMDRRMAEKLARQAEELARADMKREADRRKAEELALIAAQEDLRTFIRESPSTWSGKRLFAEVALHFPRVGRRTVKEEVRLWAKRPYRASV